jgi:hypothetical protein
MAESKPIKMTLDEALEQISDVARNGEGADKFRALKIVMSQESGSAALPEPLSDDEIIERLARMIKAAGPTASQLSYRRAFPSAKRPIYHAAPKITEADMSPIDPAALPRSLKELYRMFPEVKKPGIPTGYPVRGGMAVQKEWCQKQARRMLMDREQKRHDLIATEAIPKEELKDDDSKS